MGIGGAVLTPSSLSILRDIYDPRELGTAIGIWGTAGTIVAGVGPALGGVLADWEWRSVFWINTPLAVAFFLLALRWAPESRNLDADRHVDVTGLAALVGGLTAVTLALIQGEQWGWKSLPVIVLLAGGVVLIVAFVFIERRVRNALVDFALFRHRNFLGANVTVFALDFIFAALLFFLPLYLQELLGYSALKAGLLLLPLSAAMAIALPSGGKIADRIGTKIPITVGLVLAAIGSYLLTRLGVTSDYSRLWPSMVLLGIGFGLALTPLNIAAITAVPRATAGVAAGILTTIGGLGGVFGIALTGGLFQEQQDRHLDDLLAKAGVHVSDSTERTLSAYLSGSSEAQAEVDRFTGATKEAVIDAIHDSFVFGIANVMWLCAGLAIASAIFTALVMRRSQPESA